MTRLRSRIAALAGVLALGLGAFAIAKEIEGTDEPDKINGTEQADNITGERGDDTINGLGGDDTINGGQNSISRSRLGGDGDDTIDGGAGNDTVNGGGDNDIVNGGEGNDMVFGAGCEVTGLGRICDNVGRDRLIGGLGDDDLRANQCSDNPDCQAATNISRGTRMKGGPGNDTFLGAEKRDRIRGGGDDDTAQGYLGRDRIKGGGGNDTLDGGGGRDRVSGGSGDDQIEARDGKRDRVRCGKGDDSASVDKKDRVRGCEQVVRARLAGRLHDRLCRSRGVLLDPVEDARPHAARKVVAHAVDQIEPRVRDRTRGRSSAGRPDEPVRLAVDDERRDADPLQVLRAVAARDDRPELTGEHRPRRRRGPS